MRNKTRRRACGHSATGAVLALLLALGVHAPASADNDARDIGTQFLGDENIGPYYGPRRGPVVVHPEVYLDMPAIEPGPPPYTIRSRVFYNGRPHDREAPGEGSGVSGLTPFTPEWQRYCQARYADFDPVTGTYKTDQGVERFCE